MESTLLFQNSLYLAYFSNYQIKPKTLISTNIQYFPIKVRLRENVKSNDFLSKINMDKVTNNSVDKTIQNGQLISCFEF